MRGRGLAGEEERRVTRVVWEELCMSLFIAFLFDRDVF